MLILTCPYCGARDVNEFHYGGEAHIARPENPDQLSEEEWGDYVFFRTNPKGWHYERWTHDHGCRRWFNALRDTATDRFVATYVIGETPPLPVAQGGDDASPVEEADAVAAADLAGGGQP